MHARFYDPAGPPQRLRDAPRRVAFRSMDSVGARDPIYIVAQWLACMFLCRRFAGRLTTATARLEAGVVRYTFAAVDLHHLLLAGLPAHPWEIVRQGRPF
jgi:hypothetical protein